MKKIIVPILKEHPMKNVGEDDIIAKWVEVVPGFPEYGYELKPWPPIEWDMVEMTEEEFEKFKRESEL